MAFWHFKFFFEDPHLWHSNNHRLVFTMVPSVRQGSRWKLMDLFVFVCDLHVCWKSLVLIFSLIPALLGEVLAAVLVSFCQTWLVFFSQPNKCAKSLPNTTAHSRGNTYILYIGIQYACFARKKKAVQNICLDTSFICLHLQLDPLLNRRGRFVWGAPVEV